MALWTLLRDWLWPRVFISYAHGDRDAVAAVVETMRRAGIRFWQDERDIRPADDWQDEIRQSIRRSLAVQRKVTLQA